MIVTALQECAEMRLEPKPLCGRRPLDGFGLQCDGYLYDAVNAAAGVDKKDCVLIERRLRAIRPSLARVFCELDWFNPARDAATYRWDLPGYVNLLRLLRLLQEIGARINVVLFAPMWGQTAEAHRTSVKAFADLLVRLRNADGIAAIRWLTVYNEPETVFPHDSPLMRRIFGDSCVDGPTGWGTLMELWHLAQARLEALGLYPHVKLAVPDCVYGSPVRYERMRLAAKAFADVDADFAVHVYSPENTSTQPQDAAHQSDWGYPGMAREAEDFRTLVGATRRLILWEYNLEGRGGRTSLFPGVGPQGTAVLETPDAGPEILEKTLLAINHGYDGACLWCLADMLYCGSPAAAMQYGLWRFKNANWYPRPHYYYYAPLCQLFRADMALVPIAGTAPPLLAMAARDNETTVVVVLNRGGARHVVRLAGLPAGPARRLRVHPGTIPVEGGDLPLDAWESVAVDADGALRFDLQPREATFLCMQSTPDHEQEDDKCVS